MEAPALLKRQSCLPSLLACPLEAVVCVTPWASHPKLIFTKGAAFLAHSFQLGARPGFMFEYCWKLLLSLLSQATGVLSFSCTPSNASFVLFPRGMDSFIPLTMRDQESFMFLLPSSWFGSHPGSTRGILWPPGGPNLFSLPYPHPGSPDPSDLLRAKKNVNDGVHSRYRC